MEFDIVFEGGGAKGIAFVGAVNVIESGHHGYRRLVGTSAGAITAALLSVGYSSSELMESLIEKDDFGNPVFSAFLDRPTRDDFDDDDIENSLTMKLFRQIDLPLIPAQGEHWVDKKILERLLSLKAYPSIFSFIERGGLYVGSAFTKWLEQKLEAKGANYSQLTLSEHYNVTGKDLSVIASDTTDAQLLVLNHRTAPRCPLTWAVRMSMSIPFAWQEVIWRRNWGTYLDLDISGHTVVDGGVLSNFPIDLLLSDEHEVGAVMGETKPDSNRVLGLLIDECLKVPAAPPPPKQKVDDVAGLEGKIEQLKTVQRVKNLVETMRGAHDNQLITANEHLICRVPAKSYGTMEFDMSDVRREKLVEAAALAMSEHLKNRSLY